MNVEPRGQHQVVRSAQLVVVGCRGPEVDGHAQLGDTFLQDLQQVLA